VAYFPNALCIGGRGPFYETASTIVVQLLGKHHVTARLATYQEASRERIASLDTNGISIVCISCLDLSRSPANLRYLIQRLRSKLPHDAKIVVGLGEDGDNEATRSSIGADVITNSLEESVARCVEYALTLAKAETATETKGPAAVLPFKLVARAAAVEEPIQ
jgi:hypothetical protein